MSEPLVHLIDDDEAVRTSLGFLLEMNDLIARAETIGTELQNRIETLRFLAPYRQETDPSRN